MATTLPRADETAVAYGRLEERILARDQLGASEVFVDLVKDGRPLQELLRETVRIHAPYTHVPFHQRLDDGVVKFVNNDHCLLSARATLRLTELVPREEAWLPMGQTVWYIPTGLDPWNQLLGLAPGHYTRMYQLDVHAEPPPPQVHWPDQQPVMLDASFDEGLNHWLTLVQRSEIVEAYRVFLGLFADQANRRKLLSHLVFAGLIDIQDRMLFNRSYTTGHKAYRARATVELGDFIGWDQAHAVVYAGVPDMGVGPHWYSTYEMAGNVCQQLLEGRDHDLLAQRGELTAQEQAALEDVLLHGYEPAWQYQITDLLKAGRGPKHILDVIQVAAAELMIQTGAPENYSMPQHTVEYCNTLGWYFEHFDHPHQLKLLYMAGAMTNQAAHNQAAYPQNGPAGVRRVRGVESWDRRRILERLDQALLARDTEAGLALVSAYVASGFDPAGLVQVLAMDSARFGNDPHNQEIGLCLLEDYLKSTALGRDRLLLGVVKNITGYRKYGDPLEAYARYASAFGVSAPAGVAGDAPPEALAFDD
jgi:hypothetical protein